jgi:hypothetical protein
MVMRVLHGHGWDLPPIGAEAKGSILRVDHVQSIGTHQRSYDPAGWCLSARAVEVLGWQLDWLRSGTPEPAGSLKEVRDLLMDLAGAA